jgi:6-phospho-beta-glucosidase
VSLRCRRVRGAHATSCALKLVIVGGSAHSTPNLFAHEPLRAVSGDLDIVLAGRSAERLASVAHAIRAMCSPQAIRVTCEAAAEGSIDASLRGADVVLCQARYGGYEARASDETFPLKYGLCGDEGLGAGGLAAAWRAWPPLRATLEAVQRRCPGARVILMTSPVGVLTRCALDAFPDVRLAGICELPWTTLDDACNSVGLDGRDASFAYAGVNHLGWLWQAAAAGRDIVAEYGALRTDDDGFPQRSLIGQLRAIPLKYLRLHYEADAVVAEQRKSARPRGAELSELQQRAFEVYRTGDDRAILAVLPRRPTPWYEHAVSPFIAALSGVPASIPFFLTVRNEGYAPEFAADDALEIPHRFGDGGLVPLGPGAKIPGHLRSVLESFVAYERVASDAVSRRDQAGVTSAVRSHPWVRDSTVADALTAEICR